MTTCQCRPGARFSLRGMMVALGHALLRGLFQAAWRAARSGRGERSSGAAQGHPPSSGALPPSADLFDEIPFDLEPHPARPCGGEPGGEVLELPHPQLLMAPLTTGEMQSLREWAADEGVTVFLRVVGTVGQQGFMVHLVTRDVAVAQRLDARIGELKALRRWVEGTSAMEQPDGPSLAEG